MFRKAFAAMSVMLLCVGFSLAEEIRAVITKIDGNKITFAESKGKGEKGAEKTSECVKDVKVVKAKFNKEDKKIEAGDALESGLKNEMFTKIGEKGLRATVITNDKNEITEIRVMTFGKKTN